MLAIVIMQVHLGCIELTESARYWGVESFSGSFCIEAFVAAYHIDTPCIMEL